MGRTAGGECKIAFTENRDRHFRILAQSRQRFTTPLQSEQDPTISDPQRSGDWNGVDLPVFGTEYRDRFVGPFGQWLAFSALLLRGNRDKFIPAQRS